MRRVLQFTGLGVVRYDEGPKLTVGDVIGQWNHDRWQVVSTELVKGQILKVELVFVSGLPLPSKS